MHHPDIRQIRAASSDWTCITQTNDIYEKRTSSKDLMFAQLLFERYLIEIRYPRFPSQSCTPLTIHANFITIMWVISLFKTTASLCVSIHTVHVYFHTTLHSHQPSSRLAPISSSIMFPPTYEPIGLTRLYRTSACRPKKCSLPTCVPHNRRFDAI